MGGSSTSHGAVLRGHKDTKSSGPDLHSWQGLTEVLKKGKESLKDSGAYAEFRNLVLLYAQQGGDAELRKKIDAIIDTFVSEETIAVIPQMTVSQIPVSEPSKEIEITRSIPVVPQSDALISKENVPHHVTPPRETTMRDVVETPSSMPQFTPQTVHDIGTRRAVPSFKSSTVPRGDVLIVHEVLQQVPEVSMKDSAMQVSPPLSPMTHPEVVEIPNVVSPEPIAANVPSEHTSGKTIDAYKARITEIKHQVHEHIGNPAALMDHQNDLGKKYMTALLSALKATGSGQSAHSEMATLEDIVAQLLKRGSHKVDASIPETPHISPPEMRQALEIKVELQAQAPVVESLGEGGVTVTHEEEKKDEKKLEVPATLKKPEPSMVRRVVPEIRSRVTPPVTPKDVPPQVVIPPLLKPMKQKEDDHDLPVEKDEAVKPTVPPVPSASKAPETQSAHSPFTQMPEPLPKPKMESGRSASQQTELSTPEITYALHQLLHDWSIFGGSGFFGIGPGGAEHPIYKVLAPLSMGEVTSGRWEGSDPKVIKTIKQYVDAWRHEQGIAYTINETFEHYLRRVVQRILKRQQGGG